MLNLPAAADAAAPLHKKFIRGWAVGWNWIPDSDISPTLAQFSRGWKSAKFSVDFRLQSNLKRSNSETEQRIGNLKSALWAQMIIYLLPKCDVDRSLQFWELGVRISAFQNRSENQ